MPGNGWWDVWARRSTSKLAFASNLADAAALEGAEGLEGELERPNVVKLADWASILGHNAPVHEPVASAQADVRLHEADAKWGGLMALE